MGRLRVGLVIGQLHRGGTEKQLTALAVGLKRDHGIAPAVYCLSRIVEPYGPVLKSHGIELRSLSLKGIHKLIRPVLLARAMTADRIDLVQAFLVGPTVHAALANLAHRRPFVSSCRIVNQRRPFLNRWVESWAHNSAGMVTVNARSGMPFVRDYYRVPEAKLLFIPNGIDVSAESLPDRAAARRRLGIEGQAPVILGIGRLVPQKHLPLFCDVAEEVLTGAADGVCLIAGDGPQRAWLEQRVRSASRPAAFRLLGATDEIPLLLAAADLLLLTSRYEGTPNAVMEAMSASLPVVATEVGDVPELVQEGKTGYLLEPGDRTGLVHACRRLLGDPDSARSMGAQGRRRVESEYRMDRMVTRYAELYRSLASRRDARATARG